MTVHDPSRIILNHTTRTGGYTFSLSRSPHHEGWTIDASAGPQSRTAYGIGGCQEVMCDRFERIQSMVIKKQNVHIDFAPKQMDEEYWKKCSTCRYRLLARCAPMRCVELTRKERTP